MGPTKGKPPVFDFTDYPGLADPTWTQIPDEVLDFMLPALSGAELKVFLYVLRRTYGFKREADRITLAQLSSGIQKHDGTHLDYGTGLSRRAVIEAVKALEAKGLVNVVRSTTEDGTTDVNVYRVRRASEGRVQKSNPPRAVFAPSGVQKSNPQETVVRETVEQETEQQQPPSTPTANTPQATNPKRHGDVVVAPSGNQTPDSSNTIAARLSGLGVASSTTKALLSKHDHDTISRWIAYTEHKLASGWLPRESPAAWLVAAIRSGDWVIPEWFTTTQEKEAENQRVAEEQRAGWAQAEERERQAAAKQRAAVEEHLGIGERTRELWDQARALLRERGQFSPALFASYLLPLRGTAATIVTPVDIFCRFIESRSVQIALVLSETLGRPVETVEVKHTELPAKAMEGMPRNSRK
ncbi:MAG: replication protein [Armatimonadetes bacterium]|nr:replication protein [Armatimonadota bacterium]